MLAVQGYYDGTAFQPLEKLSVQLNQRVIITVMDDFVERQKSTEEERKEKVKKMRGCLSEYARTDANEVKERLYMARSLHGIVPPDITLEEA